MEEYAHFRKISIPEAIRHRAGRLAWRLYQYTLLRMPKVETIIAVPWFMLRCRNGRTKAQERAVRISARGFTAAGWLPAAISLGRKFASLAKKFRSLPGGYIERLDGINPSIQLINNAPGAVALEARDKIGEQAVRDEEADMALYIQRKLNEATDRFNRTR